MKKLFILLLFIVTSSTISIAQLTLRAGLGQDVGGVGGALEYKINKISLGGGVGLYDSDTDLLGWQVFGTYYMTESEDSFNSSPYLLVGYGIYGNEASKNSSGDFEIDEKYYAVYSIVGYKWWWDKVSLQLGVGAANELEADDKLDVTFSATLGIKL